MRQPSPLPELNTMLQLLQHGGLDDRLPGLHPVTAVYYAAAPVLLTLRVVPLAGALPAFAEGVGDMPSPITTAIESLLHLPADLQRLHQYVGIGSTRKLLRDATDASVSLPGHGNAESYCELTYQLGRGFYSDVVRPIDGNAAHEAMLSGELAPIDGDVFAGFVGCCQEAARQVVEFECVQRVVDKRQEGMRAGGEYWFR